MHFSKDDGIASRISRLIMLRSWAGTLQAGHSALNLQWTAAALQYTVWLQHLAILHKVQTRDACLYALP